MQHFSTHLQEDIFRAICKECSGAQFAADEGGGGYACINCGYLIEMALLTNGENAYNDRLLTRTIVHEETTSFAPFDRPFFLEHDKHLQSKKRYRLRFLATKLMLETLCRFLGMTQEDTERAFYLFKRVKTIMGWRFGRKSERLAVACLYLVSKERTCGFSITELATKARLDPLKVGHVYKRAIRALLDNDIITIDHQCFKTETDPWHMLDRLLYIGYKKDSRGVDLGLLPLTYRQILGVGMDDRDKIAKLRHLMAVAAKCLALSLDSAKGDSRTPEAMVAACVGIAVQIELKVTKVDDRFWNMLADFFYANLHTMERRRADIRSALQHVVLQHPVLARSAKLIKHSDKFAYFAEDALKYWESSNRQHRKAIQKAIQQATLREEKEEEEKEEEQEESDATDGEIDEWTSDWDEENVNVPTLDSKEGDINCEQKHRQQHQQHQQHRYQQQQQQSHPPSFVRAQMDRAVRAHQVQEALRQLSPSASTEEVLPPCSSHSAAATISQNEKSPKQRDQLAAVRLEWMKTLLAANCKTPTELEDAPDSMLEYWAEQIKRAPLGRIQRTEEELNSCEPSAKDMSDDELITYLRPPHEVEAARQALGPCFEEYEAEKLKRKHAKAFSTRKTTASTETVVTTEVERTKRRKASALASVEEVTSTKGTTQTAQATQEADAMAVPMDAPVVPKRSSRINWEAMEKLAQEDLEAEAEVRMSETPGPSRRGVAR